MFEMISHIYQVTGSSRKKVIVGVLCNILKSFFQGFMMLSVFLIMLNLDTLTSSVVLKAVVIILISILGHFFFQWMSDHTMSGTGYDIFRDYRLEIGGRLKQAPAGYFSEQNLGAIQTILTTTIADLEGYSMVAIEQMTSGIAMAFLMSFMMFFFNPIIETLSIIGLVISLTVLRLVRQQATEHSPVYQAAQENLVNKRLECIRGIVILRSFSSGKSDQQEVHTAFQKKWDADYSRERAATDVLRLYGLVYKLMSCVLIAIADILYMDGEISLPLCMTLLFCTFAVYSDLETMGNSIFLSKKINTELDRLEETADIPQMDTTTNKLHPSNHEVSLKDISFDYGSRRIVDHTSLNISEHTTRAIIGSSGNGRTTSCNLIARFRDVQKGSVCIGGQNAKGYTADSVLNCISMVFQKVYLFHDTIENSIKFGKPDASLEEITEAARRACCRGFIMALPDGYQVIIGESGSTLSDGEKQKISITRAILKGAPIVILDEATSSIDPENEQALLSAIEELAKNRTLISITHRLSTVQKADQIIMVDNGQVKQKGTHERLSKKDGIYQNFLKFCIKATGWQS